MSNITGNSTDDSKNLTEHLSANEQQPSQSQSLLFDNYTLLCPFSTILSHAKSQIGQSACGATAVLNALMALDIDILLPEVANQAVGTRLRNNSPQATLREYLISRWNAGATHIDLMRGLDILAGNRITTEFIPFNKAVHSAPGVSTRLCVELFQQNAAIIFTMNLQLAEVARGERQHDAWHHQMAFGASLPDRVILLTNPIETLTEDMLIRVLDTSSTLLIHEDDIFKRIAATTDAAEVNIEGIASGLDSIFSQWQNLHVGQQLVHLYCSRYASYLNGYGPEREHMYLQIPAAYEAGLVIIRDTNQCVMIRQ